jgi:hypothetical protein
MSDRLDTALAALGQGRSGEVLSPAAAATGTGASPSAQTQAAANGSSSSSSAQAQSSAQLAAAARDHLRNAEQAAGRGDWATYGTEMAQVHQLLDQAAAAAGS